MNTRVADVLVEKGGEVYRIRPDNTVFEAITQMTERNIGALAVIDDGEDLVGMISERDYMRKIALFGRSSKETRVDEIMTPNVVVVSPGSTLKECLAIMTEVRCRHLPVVRNGDLAGLVSIGDCARTISRDQEATVRYFTDYITGRYPA